MVVPPVRLRTPEVYREGIVLCMEIIILLGFHLLFYTILLILQQVFSSYAALILLLLPIPIIALLTLDHSSNSSLPIVALRKFMGSRERLGQLVGYAIDNMHEKARQDYYYDFDVADPKSPKIVAMWTSYVAYLGLLVQVLLRYPLSADTFFAGGMIAIAIVANHGNYFSLTWDSTRRNQNELEEVKAKLREERQRWEDEKKNLTGELVRAKLGAVHHHETPSPPPRPPPSVPKPLVRENSGSYSMFGNFDWD